MDAKVFVVLALVLTALCLSDAKPVSLSYRCPCRFFESHVAKANVKHLKILNTPNCSLQIVARLKNNNRQVCIDPKLKWIQEYLDKALNKGRGNWQACFRVCGLPIYLVLPSVPLKASGLPRVAVLSVETSSSGLRDLGQGSTTVTKVSEKVGQTRVSVLPSSHLRNRTVNTAVTQRRCRQLSKRNGRQQPPDEQHHSTHSYLTELRDCVYSSLKLPDGRALQPRQWEGNAANAKGARTASDAEREVCVDAASL
ncbi:hypothetical protein E5288_WYG013310 [Bos mutus]|nr:hypothetical protein [Bos mutus]